MTIDNSFNMISFNLGQRDSDTELLLASFHEPIKEFLIVDWSNDRDVDSESYRQVHEERINYYFNVLALEKVADEDPEIKKKFINAFYPKGNTKEVIAYFQKQALTNLIQDPQIAPLILKAQLILYNNAKIVNPDLIRMDSGLKKTEPDYHNNSNRMNVLFQNKNIQRILALQCLHELRETAEGKATRHVLETSPDIIFIQEVGQEKRQFMNALKTNFITSHFNETSDYYDTAIAVNPKRFTNVSNYSCELQEGGRAKDCTICAATDKKTGKRFAFVSAHIAGFPYTATGNELKMQAAKGNAFCKALLVELEKVERAEIKKGTPIDATIIGSDVNASPKKLKGRFNIFTDKGFDVKGTGSPTNTHFLDTSDKVREIDYFFARTRPLFGRIKQWFKSDKIEVTASSFTKFGFDKVNNMSDHKPIAGKVAVTEKMSYSDKIKKTLTPHRYSKSKQANSDNHSIIRSLNEKVATVEFEGGELSRLVVHDWSKIGFKEFLALTSELRQGIETSCLLEDDVEKREKLNSFLGIMDGLLLSLNRFDKPKNKADAFKATANDIVNEIINAHGDILIKSEDLISLKPLSQDEY